MTSIPTMRQPMTSHPSSCSIGCCPVTMETDRASSATSLCRTGLLSQELNQGVGQGAHPSRGVSGPPERNRAPRAKNYGGSAIETLQKSQNVRQSLQVCKPTGVYWRKARLDHQGPLTNLQPGSFRLTGASCEYPGPSDHQGPSGYNGPVWL